MKSLINLGEGGLNLQKIKFIGNTANFRVDTSGMTFPDEIKHLEDVWQTFWVIEYSKPYEIRARAHGNLEFLKRAFLTQSGKEPGVFPRYGVYEIPFARSNSAEYKPSSGGPSFVSLPGLVHPDTSEFFAYHNIDRFVNALSDVQVHGVIDVNDGAALQVPQSLKTSELDKAGYKLQLSKNGETWVNVSLDLEKITANPIYDIPEIPAGQGQLITLSQNQSLYLRLVPFKDDVGRTVSISDWSSYQSIIENKKLKVQPSDYVRNNFTGPTVVEVDLSNQKQSINIPNDPSQWQISFSGRTNDNFAVQFSIGGQTWQEALQSLNSGLDQNLSEKVKPVFLISYLEDASPNYFIALDNFVLWLNGQLQVDSEGFVVDPSGNRVSGIDSLTGKNNASSRWPSFSLPANVSNSKLELFNLKYPSQVGQFWRRLFLRCWFTSFRH
ncbi:hypothetical protein [Mycoplasma sp. ATU-Cv-508]|uniref:hypothetical protein n=1 Tax=Mycoplasma sp. ATU-Cv-508 TaxID=2048001 RepID=UPI000FDE1877